MFCHCTPDLKNGLTIRKPNRLQGRYPLRPGDLKVEEVKLRNNAPNRHITATMTRANTRIMNFTSDQSSAKEQIFSEGLYEINYEMDCILMMIFGFRCS